MSNDGKIRRVQGFIMLDDGTTSEFSIVTDGGWQQWAANTGRLGKTADAVDAMSRALMEDELLASEADEDTDEPEEYPLALLVGVRSRHHAELPNMLAALPVGAWFMDGTGWRVWSEPVGEDENDGVTFLVHIDVQSLDQGRVIAIGLDQAGMLSPYVDTDHQEALMTAAGATPTDVLGFVTNAHTYCEGVHWAILRGADPVNLLA